MKVGVEFESPMLMSFRNGTTTPSSGFMLCEDGTVRYKDADDGSWREWESNAPRWEFPSFPVLPVVYTGYDL